MELLTRLRNMQIHFRLADLIPSRGERNPRARRSAGARFTRVINRRDPEIISEKSNARCNWVSYRNLEDRACSAVEMMERLLEAAELFP